MQRVIITIVVVLMLMAGCKDKEPEMEYFYLTSNGYAVLMPTGYVSALKSLQNEINKSKAIIATYAEVINVANEMLDEQGEQIRDLQMVASYDPNDRSLRFLSKPPAAWTKEHGDSERSLLLYNLAATSVVAKEALRSVGVVSRCVVKVHPSFVIEKDGNQIMDPNNYAEPEWSESVIESVDVKVEVKE